MYYSEKIKKHFKGNLVDLKIAIWGLAFKPDTDDIREAPALDVIDFLLKEGAKVFVYDPVALNEVNLNQIKSMFSNDNAAKRLFFNKKQYDPLEKADALCFITEWKPFREPDFEKMKNLMKTPVIFDGRNLFSPETMKKMGFKYYSIGRKES